MDRAKALVGIGIVILLVGAAMPSILTNTETSCTDTRVIDGEVTCMETSEATTVQKNDYRVPLIVSGGAISVVGMVILTGDD